MELQPSRPARYLLTEGVGAVFDEATEPSPAGRAEPAILDGRRALFDRGVVLASVPEPSSLRGVRAMPERLGGGFVLWSRDRTYRARDVLGDLVPVADVGGAVGGARPWLTTIMLRTDRGVVELDPADGKSRDAALPGLADGLAADAMRGVLVDLLGRARVTLDGGATWTDVLATRGLYVLSVAARDGDVWLTDATRKHELRLDGSVDRGALAIDDDVDDERLFAAAQTSLAHRKGPAHSRSFASDLVAHAVVAGALLPGGRALVAREGGLRVLGASNGHPVDDRDLDGVAIERGGCQPYLAGRDLLLACVHETGAHVLRVRGTAVSLEIAFAERGGFVAGDHGALGFRGDDREAGGDGSRFQVRTEGGAWIERRLASADDVRKLYRWIPREDGAAIAIVIGGVDQPAVEGVRVTRVDPTHAALAGALLPRVLAPREGPPHRTIDDSFWCDDRGAVHGWVLLPGADGPAREGADDTPKGPLAIGGERGGRRAGVTFEASGGARIHALPEGTIDVVHGGRFALSVAERGGGSVTAESTDGGVTWREVAGPPVGRLATPDDLDAPASCSAIGCTWGSGVVRLGWGGDPPAGDRLSPYDEGPAPAAPRLPVLACDVDAQDAPDRASITLGAADGVRLDLDDSQIVLAQGDLTAAVLAIARVPSPEPMVLTLGRAATGAPWLVATSATTGRVVAGLVDLARAEIGPLASLGSFAAMRPASDAACEPRSVTHRFVAAIELPVRLHEAGAASREASRARAKALFSRGRAGLCLEAIEAQGPGDDEVSADLRRGAAVLRRQSRSMRARCVLQPR